MTNIDIIRKFYSLPRITAEDRVDLLRMLHPEIHYVGIGKESARGKDAVERLFQKYESGGRGITNVKFDIKHIAENGDTVLVDMVMSFVIERRPFSDVWSNVFKIKDGLIVYWQEHYSLAKFEAMFSGGVPVTESKIPA